MKVAISIVLCTRNRSADLRETLASIGHAVVPVDMTAEVVVVDNGSIDGTRAAVENSGLGNVQVRYAYVPEQGKSRALNDVMPRCTGTIQLHTDDDVRVPTNWLELMCRPIMEGRADAVAGSVRLAPHLVRKWMKPVHLACFAWDFSAADDCGVMIGANMAFHRRLTDAGLRFDENLGPGALGFSDDVLFAWQAQAAGFRIISAGNCFVEHHFRADRLLSSSLRDRAEREGRVEAYLAYHWLNSRVRWPAVKERIHSLRLRFRDGTEKNAVGEGCDERVMERLRRRAFMQQWRLMTASPRRYIHSHVEGNGR